ncbi:hypothetical protein [Haloferula sp. BvORR071]|uniref:hypothetical protein n=1 Tax=Haloferula sp. BvORR071 TaxID=1396141 RepID=UPI002240F2F1|nr:hypothetical protein [Haloferula sp. BvORR071]
MWNENNGASIEKKLEMNSSNLMLSYKEDGSAAGLILNPNASTLTFSGRGGGLRHSSGGSVLRFDSSGNPIFDHALLLLELDNCAGTSSNAITTLKNGETTLTSKAWKANAGHLLKDLSGSTDSDGQALEVEAIPC